MGRNYRIKQTKMGYFKIFLSHVTAIICSLGIVLMVFFAVKKEQEYHDKYHE